MKENNVIVEKSFQFGLRIVKLYMHLRKQKVERELVLQMLRSGTSIGANIEESIGGSSTKDFIYKLEVAYKESRETRFWIRLLNQSDLLENKLADSFLKDCEEIMKILTAILNTTKKRRNS